MRKCLLLDKPSMVNANLVPIGDKDAFLYGDVDLLVGEFAWLASSSESLRLLKPEELFDLISDLQQG